MSGIKLVLWNVNGKEWIHYSAVFLNSLPEKAMGYKDKLTAESNSFNMFQAHAGPPELKGQHQTRGTQRNRPNDINYGALGDYHRCAMQSGQ